MPTKIKKEWIIGLSIPVLASILGYLVVSALTPIQPMMAAPKAEAEIRVPVHVVPLSPALAALAMGMVGGVASLMYGWYAGVRGAPRDRLVRDLGELTSLALRRDIPTLTARDLELMLYMKEMGEFTVGDLVARCGLTRQAVWKLVAKLEKSEIIRKQRRSRKDIVKLRGAPPITYKFVG